MKYEDLYQFPKGHPPSPYDMPVVIFNVGEVNLPADLQLYAVGWIEEPGFTTGDVAGDCIDGLVAATPDKINTDGTRGWHRCTLCTVKMPKIEWKGKQVELSGHGHYLVRKDNSVYMAPALLLHYVFDHHYSPPQVFCDAVVNGKFLTAEDLVVKPSA